MAERQRIGMMVERLEKLKLRATDCGPRNCRLCGQSFGLLSLSKQICDDCHHQVCSKCSIELTTKTLQGERFVILTTSNNLLGSLTLSISDFQGNLAVQNMFGDTRDVEKVRSMVL